MEKHRNPFLIEREIAEATRRREHYLGLAGWIRERISRGYPNDDLVRMQRLLNDLLYEGMRLKERIEALGEEFEESRAEVRRAAGLEEVGS